MRSRYAAYAARDIAYILDTTHPASPHAQADREAWTREVNEFCHTTRFEGLEVLDSGEAGDDGWVRFRATLSQGRSDASFGEHSTFRRVEGRWLYDAGRALDPPGTGA